MSRRSLLVCLLACLGVPAATGEASDLDCFRVAQLAVGGRAPVRSSAPMVLAQEVRYRTFVEVRLDRVVVSLDSDALYQYPFLLWVGDGAFPPLAPEERDRLRTFLQLGGFLLVDNAGEGPAREAFEKSFREEFRRLLPGADLRPIPPTHVIFRSFYRLSSVAGRWRLRPFLEGAFLGDRVALVYSHNDLSGAWSRDGFGRWEYETVPGGAAQREEAIRLGVNLALYALLLDYKDEQAHVEGLLNRRRLPPAPPRGP